MSATASSTLRRPHVEAIPAEVQVARAFVAMTGIDPSSVFHHQSPPVRERPRSHGPARPKPTARRRQRVRGMMAQAWRSARQRLQQAVAWAAGLWSRAKRALTGP